MKIRKILFAVVMFLVGVTLVACVGGTEEDPVDTTYSISFVNYDDSVLQRIDVKEGILPTYTSSTPTRPSSNTKEYTFKEWSPVIVVASKDATYKAVYNEVYLEVTEYNVIFNSDGGSLVATQSIKEEEKATKPLDPTKADHKFLGWYLGDVEFNFETKINANTTLVAKWEKVEPIIPKVEYTVTFNVDGGSEMEPQTVEEGKKATKPLDPTKADHKFLGWYLGNVEFNFETKINANTILIAKWEKILKNYTVNFDSKGGTHLNSITVVEGTSIKEPNKPTKEDSVFIGWFDSNDNKVTWPITLNSNLSLYAGWNEAVPYGQYLKALLGNYQKDIYDFIPETMQPGHMKIDVSKTELSFEQFVNVGNIPYGGYGEQWQMVIDNLEQTKVFFNALNVVDSLSSVSIAAFNNYLDSNPADSSKYEFTESIYQVSIKFEDKTLYYVLDYTTNIPLLGEQTVQVALDYNIETLVKNGRIQLGDANVIKYEFGQDHFTLALRYLGVRRTFFNVSRSEDDIIEGQIFEYLEVLGVEIKSVANFYIDENYVSVVGTKADGILLMDSYINELYDVNHGKLLGYEVKETKTVLGFSGTFNTMWFNLDNAKGINNIKVVDEANGLNPNSIYVNNSTELFITENVSFINRSRKYDIEMRKQYFYYQDGEDLVKVQLEIPMLFVQEEHVEDHEEIIKDKNNLDVFELTLNQMYIDKIQLDYNLLIDILIEDVDLITVDVILDYIGTKYEQ